MLVNFAVDPQALLKESNPIPIHFDRLLEKWENFGVLVNAYEIEDKLASLEFSIREQLEEIFKDDEPPLRYRFLENAPPQMDWETLDDDSIGKLRDWDEHFELAIIEETLAEIIGVGPSNEPLSFDDQQAICGNVEPIGLAIADRARAWSLASGISRKGFEVGDDYELLWNERFKRLAEYSSQIVIIDAYALHGRQLDGFIKLLQMIDRDANSCRVTLFSSPTEDSDEAVRNAREVLENEVDRLSRGGIQQITIRLLPLDEQEHDRHFRFDCNVYEPGNSIALVFSGNQGTVEQRVSCSLQISDGAYHPFDDLKEIENELLKRAKRLNWLATEDDFFVLQPN